ncbi:MAG: fibrillarin-like rRNA/tRNA 2'-O-methyltransferase [Methanosarcinales archaeon]
MKNTIIYKEKIATKNLVPSTTVYGETLISIEGEEYRLWDPHRSKLASIVIESDIIPINPDSKILYLGAATGTTVSHVSDIASEGLVYAVEFSPRSMVSLIKVSELRKNLIPILADATKPNIYANIVEPVDLIYQDVAQRNQAEIAIQNAKWFLKKDGYVIIIIKARSIDTTANPKHVFDAEIKKLESVFKIIKIYNLPFHKDNIGVLALQK